MTDPPNECLFCQRSAGVIILENDLAFAIPDRFEVTKLHTLVIPKRHAIDYFSLTNFEVQACNELLCRLRLHIRVSKHAAPALCKCLRVTMLATGTYLRTTPDRVPGRV